MDTTYPDGSVLRSTALTIPQIQTAFQFATCQMLGIITDPWTVQFTLTIGDLTAPTLSTNNLYSGQLVNCPGLPDGTYITGIIDDGTVAFSNAATLNGAQAGSVTDPGAYSKVRIGWQQQGQPFPGIDEDVCFIRCTPVDSEYSKLRNITRVAGDTTITETDSYTRAWRTFWTFYGPNSVDRARAVRSALIKIDYFDYLLATNSLFVNPSIDEPVRVPEEFQGEWWERVDLSAMFNEAVTETFVVNAVASVEVIGNIDTGEFTDFTVKI